MVLNEKFKKSLARHEGMSGALLRFVSFFTPLFFMVMGFLNLWSAFRVGALADLTLADFARHWLEAIDINKEYTYSGVFLLGMQRFNTALLQFACFIVLAPFPLSVSFQRRRDRAVIEALKKHGEI